MDENRASQLSRGMDGLLVLDSLDHFLFMGPFSWNKVQINCINCNNFTSIVGRKFLFLKKTVENMSLLNLRKKKKKRKKAFLQSLANVFQRKQRICDIIFLV
jgi:hypothetical protein